MNVAEYLEHLLRAESLSDKLTPATNLDYKVDKIYFKECRSPGRSSKISFSDEQELFPKKKQLKQSSARAKALHFFANHEMLAIEIMADIILKHYDEVVRRGLLDEMLEVIAEEQTHLKLYVDRMNELGVEFGDFSLNDFFWRQSRKVQTLDSYFSVMSLTFEAANLDFALYYSNLFKEYEDPETAKILGIVLRDEIKHVKLGAGQLMSQCSRGQLWDRYVDLLPDLMTPARSKGIHFNKELRYKCGLPEEFVDQLVNYQDNFSVTNRKK
jgi:uncharacterized ferritin-like protein (DUF455 family)